MKLKIAYVTPQVSFFILLLTSLTSHCSHTTGMKYWSCCEYPYPVPRDVGQTYSTINFVADKRQWELERRESHPVRPTSSTIMHYWSFCESLSSLRLSPVFSLAAIRLTDQWGEQLLSTSTFTSSADKIMTPPPCLCLLPCAFGVNRANACFSLSLLREGVPTSSSVPVGRESSLRPLSFSPSWSANNCENGH